MVIRTMVTGEAKNEDLKVSKLFDVSNFSAIATGGGSGTETDLYQLLIAIVVGLTSFSQALA